MGLLFSGPIIFYGLLPFGLKVLSARYWPVPKRNLYKTQGFSGVDFLNLWHIFSMAFSHKNLLDKFARCNMFESSRQMNR